MLRRSNLTSDLAGQGSSLMHCDAFVVGMGVIPGARLLWLGVSQATMDALRIPSRISLLLFLLAVAGLLRSRACHTIEQVMQTVHG
jgi:hypothetical protein